MTGVGPAIEGTLVASLAAGLPVTIRVVRRAHPVAGAVAPPRWAAHPGFWLLLVIVAGYVNQVLFTIYVIRVHGGDVSFIARYLPTGWFATPSDNHMLRALATVFPAPHLLAASVLRVQAVLELPLVVLGYLTVCRWWDRRLYQSLAAPLPLTLTCTTYTITFCLIEWSLRNPYTAQDLILRALSVPGTVAAISCLAGCTRVEDRQPPPIRSAVGVLLFGVSATALGYLILTVYDTVLLYNLAHVPARLAGSLTALAALTAARYTARRLTRRSPGLGMDTITTALGWFAALFFTPALPVRYVLGFADPAVAATATIIVLLAAAVLTGAEVYRRLPAPHGRRITTLWLTQSSAAALAGVAAASLARLSPPGSYPEAKLLLAGALFLLAATITYALTDPLISHQHPATRALPAHLHGRRKRLPDSTARRDPAGVPPKQPGHHFGTDTPAPAGSAGHPGTVHHGDER